VGLVLGACLGIIIWVVAELIPPHSDLANWVYEIVNCFAAALTYLYVELATSFDLDSWPWRAAPYAVVLQWALVGLLCGWWLQRKKAAKERPAKLADK